MHMFLKSSIFLVILAIVQVQNLGFGGGGLHIYINIPCKRLICSRNCLNTGAALPSYTQRTEPYQTQVTVADRIAVQLLRVLHFASTILQRRSPPS